VLFQFKQEVFTDKRFLTANILRTYQEVFLYSKFWIADIIRKYGNSVYSEAAKGKMQKEKMT
jgi:hypothetical protein